MTYERLIEKKTVEIGGREFAISKIPAEYAQTVYNAVADAVNKHGLLGQTMLPQNIIGTIFSYVAINDPDWIMIDTPKVYSEVFGGRFDDSQKVLIQMLKYNFSFFLSGDLLNELAEQGATDSAS